MVHFWPWRGKVKYHVRLYLGRSHKRDQLWDYKSIASGFFIRKTMLDSKKKIENFSKIFSGSTFLSTFFYYFLSHSAKATRVAPKERAKNSELVET